MLTKCAHNDNLQAQLNKSYFPRCLMNLHQKVYISVWHAHVSMPNRNHLNKNAYLVSNFYHKLKFPALFSMRNNKNCSQGCNSYSTFPLVSCLNWMVWAKFSKIHTFSFHVHNRYGPINIRGLFEKSKMTWKLSCHVRAGHLT